MAPPSLLAHPLPPSLPPPSRPPAQVVGVFVAYNYYRVLSSGGSCAVSTDLLWACALMYSTYLYLFCEFAVRRYILGPWRAMAAKGKAKKTN